MVAMTTMMARRLAIKPGVSLHRTDFLSMESQKALPVSTTSSEVRMVLTISTIFITGTGLKKCNPNTWVCLLVAMAMSRIDRHEVLLARMAWGGQALSRAPKTLFF